MKRIYRKDSEGAREKRGLFVGHAKLAPIAKLEGPCAAAGVRCSCSCTAGRAEMGVLRVGSCGSTAHPAALLGSVPMVAILPGPMGTCGTGRWTGTSVSP